MRKLGSYKLIWVVFHFAMGILLLSPLVSKMTAQLVFVLGFAQIYLSRNQNNEALFWSMYLVSAEVLFRMTDGLFFHESVKYEVIVLLLLGMLVEQRKHGIPVVYILYLLLLSIGIAFSDIPAGESIRKAVAFNLSGPVVLGVSALYMYHRKLEWEDVYKLLWLGVLPVISMLSFLFLRTPDLKEITFNTQANFAMSGGFGPNQVATILGFGMFLIAVLILFRKRLTNYLILDILILLYVTYRGVITFSRGGMLTAFLALGILAFFYFLAQPHKLYTSFKYIVLAFILGAGVWLYTSNITGGMIDNRYSGKNASGVKKEDMTSGREAILKTDFQYFYENPVLGVGVGSAKYKRLEEEEDVTAASHNEVGRLLSEHGLIGLLSLVILMIIPLYHLKQVDILNKGFVLAFYVFWFLTINHSAMRVAFPGFVYGLSLLTIIPNRQPTTEKIE